MTRRDSRVTRVLSELGMALVLVGLCVYYSWATWGVQFAEGAEAAREVLREVPADARGVLVVGQQGRGAEEAARRSCRQEVSWPAPRATAPGRVAGVPVAKA